MNEQEKLQAIAITKELKTGIRSLLNKHASAIAMLSPGNDDPHTPVIGCSQMALAQASVEYLITCGCTPNEAVNNVVNNVQHAMNQWLNSVLRPVEKTKIIKP